MEQKHWCFDIKPELINKAASQVGRQLRHRRNKIKAYTFQIITKSTFIIQFISFNWYMIN